jgi:flagellar biosynthesis/type III secretory pathway M-ring protein FliF/YscJ
MGGEIMMKKSRILILVICYIGTILIAIFALLTYLKRRDEALLFSQLFLTLVALINSILTTIKYKKQNK